MRPLLREIYRKPLLWLLVFVPVVFITEHMKPDAGTLLFVLSIPAIIPLAALLSHATESIACKTGDTVGGLLNATLGNLTEPVIALSVLHFRFPTLHGHSRSWKPLWDRCTWQSRWPGW